MAERNFKVNELIKIVYQAPNKESGLTVIAEIVLPGDVKDSNFPDVILIEELGKGIYTGEFTPDAQGEWQTIVYKQGGSGQVIKRYSVGGYDVHSIGEVVDNINTSVSSIDTPPMIS